MAETPTLPFLGKFVGERAVAPLASPIQPHNPRLGGYGKGRTNTVEDIRGALPVNSNRAETQIPMFGVNER